MSSPRPWTANSSNGCRNFKTRLPRGRTRFEARNIPTTIAELEARVSDPNIWSDQKAANELFGKLRTLKRSWEPIAKLAQDIEELIQLAHIASEGDRKSLEETASALEQAWSGAGTALYISGEFDQNNCYVTVSGGAGGTEAQDWAAILLRMYLRYCERQGWKTEMVDETRGQEAGIKTSTIHVIGSPAYGYLKCEKGTHRLVRLSPFNAKNLRQTSFALVEVLPEIAETKEIVIPTADLRIDTFRSGGAGGQHVNRTDSAVRLTHIPTGIVVSCQSERSQIQNRTQAMNMLRAKLLEMKRNEEEAAKSALKGAKQSADFGQQIRSYVLHPYQMVKDLRTEVETSDTQGVLDGALQQFIDAELKRLAKE